MKSIVKIVLIGLIGVLFIGCSAKTRVTVHEQNNQYMSKFDRANVIVTDEDIYSIEDDQTDILEDLREDIVDKLNDMGIESGGQGLTIKVIISNFEAADTWMVFPLPGKAGRSAISAEVRFIDSNQELISKININSNVEIKLYEDSFKEHAEEAFLRELIGYMKENILFNEGK